MNKRGGLLSHFRFFQKVPKNVSFWNCLKMSKNAMKCESKIAKRPEKCEFLTNWQKNFSWNTKKSQKMWVFKKLRRKNRASEKICPKNASNSWKKTPNVRLYFCSKMPKYPKKCEFLTFCDSKPPPKKTPKNQIKLEMVSWGLNKCILRGIQL